MTEYPYITENNLYQKQYYNYAVCDDAFFHGYEASRIVAETPENAVNGLYAFCREDLATYYQKDTDAFVTRKALDKLILTCGEEDLTEEPLTEASKLVKTFEVRKRLYHSYNAKMRPFDERDFEDLNLYVLFACMTFMVYRRTKDLKYLNALLKVDDILLSIQGKYPVQEELAPFLAWCVAGEKKCVDTLMGEGDKYAYAE